MPTARFDLVAGDPALDLVNTVSWRGDPARTIERIGDFPALADWARRAGVLDDEEAARLLAAAGRDERAAARATTATHALRERLHAIVIALVDGGAPDPSDLRAVNDDVVAALSRASVRPVLPLDWEPVLETPADLHHALALHALRLLRSPDAGRIGRCSDPVCGWLFVDHSRNHSRRWCSSADCGNRDRVGRHHARHRGA
jgi:predicted RNA-binding Zn ribbon-like protein